MLNLFVTSGPSFLAQSGVAWDKQGLFIGIGFGVVLGILIGLALATALVGRIFKYLEERSKSGRPLFGGAGQASAQGAARETAETARAAAAPAGMDPRAVAIIAAAVHATLGQRVRVVSMRPVQAGWAQEGRRAHFRSHAIR